MEEAREERRCSSRIWPMFSMLYAFVSLSFSFRQSLPFPKKEKEVNSKAPPTPAFHGQAFFLRRFGSCYAPAQHVLCRLCFILCAARIFQALLISSLVLVLLSTSNLHEPLTRLPLSSRAALCNDERGMMAQLSFHRRISRVGQIFEFPKPPSAATTKSMHAFSVASVRLYVKHEMCSICKERSVSAASLPHYRLGD